MTKILSILLFFSWTAILGQTGTIKVKKDKKQTASGQLNFKIQGLWECYASLSDTTDPDGVQLWYNFDDTKMSALFVPSLGLPPEKAGINSTEKYKLKNDTLQTFHKNGNTISIIYVLNNNLISLRSSDEKEKVIFYLKRTIKK